MTSTLDAPEMSPADSIDIVPPAPATRTSVLDRTDRTLGVRAAPRPISSVTPRSVFLTLGSLVSAFCFTLLLFGRLTSFSGRVGFVFVFLASFVVLYAFLVSLDEEPVTVVDRIMTVVMTLAMVVAMFALGSILVFVFIEGRDAFFRWNFFTEDLSVTGPQEPLDSGGITHAIIGTLIMISIAFCLTVPLAITCAVYLNESSGRIAELVRSVITAMTALPSIVAGLFVLALYILILGFPKSGFAAAIAISLMMLPIIARSADVVLRLVPGSLREAAAALGAPRWRVVWHVVLPTAKSGLTTSVLLGVARGIGETAPVLLVAGNGTSWNINPFDAPMMSLPLQTFNFVKSGVPNQVARGFATALTLLILVLVLFTVARIFGGRQPGDLSNRQRARAAKRSAADLERIEGVAEHTSSTPGGVASPPSPELEPT